MVLLAVVIVSVVCGLAVALGASRLPHAGRTSPPRRVRRAAHLDPEAATGLALTLALVLLVAGGVVLAILTFTVRGASGGIGLDTSVGDWGARHATPFTTHVLDALTDVGQPGVIAVLAAVVAVIETVRTGSRWVVPFVLLVVAGNGIVTTTIKNVADRVRPSLNPIAETLGPSFPSGHSSWSAACFAAAALLLARDRDRRTRTVLAGLSAAIAIAIGATRVLLGVHWLSDVIAGLALGWAWFAVCAIAFGGRLLRFGATAGADSEHVPRGARVSPPES